MARRVVVYRGAPDLRTFRIEPWCPVASRPSRRPRDRDRHGRARGAREAIALSARIVSIADVFDALTHERPYKHAWTLNDALAEIEQLAGRQFDPQVVTAFLSLDHRDVALQAITERSVLAPLRAEAESGAPQRTH